MFIDPFSGTFLFRSIRFNHTQYTNIEYTRTSLLQALRHCSNRTVYKLSENLTRNNNNDKMVCVDMFRGIPLLFARLNQIRSIIRVR